MLTCTMKYVYNDRLLVSLSDNKIYFYMPILCQSNCSETEMQSLCGVSTLTVIIWFTFIIFLRNFFVILTSTFPFHWGVLSVGIAAFCGYIGDGFPKIGLRGENRWII